MRRSVSYAGYSSSSAAASSRMARNTREGGVAEQSLRAAAKAAGLRFVTHSALVPGRPDLAFPSALVAVFCDGDFWHGRNWPQLRTQLRGRANGDYWIAKID